MTVFTADFIFFFSFSLATSQLDVLHLSGLPPPADALPPPAHQDVLPPPAHQDVLPPPAHQDVLPQPAHQDCSPIRTCSLHLPIRTCSPIPPGYPRNLSTVTVSSRQDPVPPGRPCPVYCHCACVYTSGPRTTRTSTRPVYCHCVYMSGPRTTRTSTRPVSTVTVSTRQDPVPPGRPRDLSTVTVSTCQDPVPPGHSPAIFCKSWATIIKFKLIYLFVQISWLSSQHTFLYLCCLSFSVARSLKS